MGGSFNLDMLQAQIKVKNEKPVQSDVVNKVEGLINRFEDAAGKLGDELWRIH